MKKKITWLQKMKKDRLNSVWYGGDMVRIEFDHYLITISAVGDIRAIIKGEHYCDKNNGGCFADYLKENGIGNDAELQKAEDNGDIVWLNNNWFEIIIWDDKNKDYIDCWGDEVCDLEPSDNFNWVKSFVKDLVD